MTVNLTITSEISVYSQLKHRESEECIVTVNTVDNLRWIVNDPRTKKNEKRIDNVWKWHGQIVQFWENWL